MKFLIALALLASAAFGGAKDDMKVWMVFLMLGTEKGPTDKAEGEAMQAAHIANLVDIWKNHGGYAAGPLADPTKQRRGIVVLQAKDEDSVKALFKNDPYVNHKIMTVKAMEWLIDPKVFAKEIPDPNALGPYRLIVFKKAEPDTFAQLKLSDHGNQVTYLNGLKKTHQIKVSGGILRQADLQGLAIAIGEDDKGLAEAISGAPLVKSKALEYEIIPLWMSKGMFH